MQQPELIEVFAMRTVWLLVVMVLVASVVPICAADETKKDIPLYEGKPGAKIGDVSVNPKDGAEMMWVPAGKFIMGTTDTDAPQHKVYLDGYWIYKTEVTVAQYRQFCQETSRQMPDTPKWGWIDEHPVVNVTWQDAADYAKWASVILPTEAQWEKAARGTDGRIYPWGNEWDDSKCVSDSLHPVGSKPSGVSPYGCIDMAGNVWEWCADWYAIDYYKSAPDRNPNGPSNGVARVLRGGSWYNNYIYYFQCAYRRNTALPPNDRLNLIGFRCAGTP